MKTLKFKHEFAKEILEGRKTTTWRLFDDKDLTIGDELELLDRDSGESIGKAVIADLLNKKIKDLTVEELNNHGYDNVDAMIMSHKGYYGGKVDFETDVKILTFKLL